MIIMQSMNSTPPALSLTIKAADRNDVFVLLIMVGIFHDGSGAKSVNKIYLREWILRLQWRIFLIYCTVTRSIVGNDVSDCDCVWVGAQVSFSSLSTEPSPQNFVEQPTHLLP